MKKQLEVLLRIALRGDWQKAASHTKLFLIPAAREENQHDLADSMQAILDNDSMAGHSTTLDAHPVWDSLLNSSIQDPKAASCNAQL